jgi:hypothetical protein
MALVVAERVFEVARNVDELRAREDAVSWCLATHRVRRTRTYLSADGQRTVCLYDAPDAESVRVTQRAAGLPVEQAWPAIAVADLQVERPDGYSLVIVLRALPEVVSVERVQYMLTDPTGCGRRLGLVRAGAFLSFDGCRLCCVFYSPDLESVRVSSREAGAPIERLWKAERIDAPV